MKQIVVISGKGGTGKTIFSSSFAVLAKNSVAADCDVDAANMHLLLHPQIEERHEFMAGQKAVLDKEQCIKCGKCVEACRFEAISDGYIIDAAACEGCGLCQRICPVKAIKMKPSTAGEWFVSKTKYGPFIHARLGIAEDNSGKLVSKVREAAKKKAEDINASYIIVDGPPGTGCPVMAAITGVDLAVVVTEPTVSGVHDLKRVAEVLGHFKIKAGIVVNKSDINTEKTSEIKEFALKSGMIFFGELSFSKEVSDAVINCKPPVEYCGENITGKIKEIWKSVETASN
ncbi:MAG: ATP-binding protein [Candidatus Goldbacteria bacterium]|nr:ATP-binding protein [Candidatus Goldiibacteriota bacterium]